MTQIDWGNIENWAAKSRNKELCGIFGCLEVPVIRCNHCGNWYCSKHSWVLDTPSHPQCQKESIVPIENDRRYSREAGCAGGNDGAVNSS